MKYNYCGHSGLQLPAISLGFWHNFGRILHNNLLSHRDEMIISTKAGYMMWPGPYGDGGSRKYLMASLDQSLKRMGLDYVDIFYSHRYDANTPIEEKVQRARALNEEANMLQ